MRVDDVVGNGPCTYAVDDVTGNICHALGCHLEQETRVQNVRDHDVAGSGPG